MGVTWVTSLEKNMRLLMYAFISPRTGPRTGAVAGRLEYQVDRVPDQAPAGVGAAGGERWALPHTWITGDDEMGRPSGFRRELRALGQRYLLAVPSNTTVRDIDAPPPAYSGCGPRRKSPFVRVDKWCAALPEDAWTKIEVRDGEKGPLVIGALKRRVQARTERRETGPEELLS